MKMTTARDLALVLITAPNLRVARALAQGMLCRRLAACANLVPAVESHFWWQGKLESAREILLLVKTSRRRLGALEKFVLAEHPYDTPEFIVLPIQSGQVRYLKWVRGETS